jgi:hypothetical protein
MQEKRISNPNDRENAESNQLPLVTERMFASSLFYLYLPPRLGNEGLLLERQMQRSRRYCITVSEVQTLHKLMLSSCHLSPYTVCDKPAKLVDDPLLQLNR